MSNLYFVRQLPFYPPTSTHFPHLSVTTAFRPIPANSLQLLSQSVIHRGSVSPSTISPSTPESLFSSSSEITLSPTLPPLEPSDPFEWLFIDSFNNLAIHHQDRETTQARLNSLNRLINNILKDLIEERDLAVRAIEHLTAKALRTVWRRLLPEIKRIETILNQED